MAIKRFVEALSKAPRVRHTQREDMIPGTNKVRTFVSNPRVYSEESDLENILKHNQYRNVNPSDTIKK